MFLQVSYDSDVTKSGVLVFILDLSTFWEGDSTYSTINGGLLSILFKVFMKAILS